MRLTERRRLCQRCGERRATWILWWTWEDGTTDEEDWCDECEKFAANVSRQERIWTEKESRQMQVYHYEHGPREISGEEELKTLGPGWHTDPVKAAEMKGKGYMELPSAAERKEADAKAKKEADDKEKADKKAADEKAKADKKAADEKAEADKKAAAGGTPAT